MKLIDKDAVLAEIESLLDKGKHHDEYDCAYRDGNNGALYALKGKINSLEVKAAVSAEEPIVYADSEVSDSLEEEIERMWQQEDRYQDTDYKIAELDKQSYEDCARHFANWQKQQILDSNTTLQRTFELGKQEMKQQMMKDAAEGIFGYGELALPEDFKKQLSYGDKVIIIKKGQL